MDKLQIIKLEITDLNFPCYKALFLLFRKLMWNIKYINISDNLCNFASNYLNNLSGDMPLILFQLNLRAGNL